MEEDALNETAGLERSHACLEGQADWLVVDEIHFITVNSKGE
jgi:hypothetical protein